MEMHRVHTNPRLGQSFPRGLTAEFHSTKPIKGASDLSAEGACCTTSAVLRGARLVLPVIEFDPAPTESAAGMRWYFRPELFAANVTVPRR